MRTLLLPFVLLTLSGFCLGQAKKSDRETAGLLGPVRTVGGTSVDYTGEIKGIGFMKKGEDLVTYDANGFEIERRPISDFGEAMGRMTRTVDSDGRITASAWFDPKGSLVSRDAHIYENGKPTEQRTYDGKDNLVETTQRSYDSFGRLIRETYLEQGKPVARTEFKNTGQSVEASFFMADGSKAVAPAGPCLGAHRVVTVHDGEGRVTSQSFFEPDGKLKRSAKYTYNAEGRVVEYVGGTAHSTTTATYKYENDAKGNWIKRVQTASNIENGLTVFGYKPEPYVRITVTTREITYF